MTRNYSRHEFVSDFVGRPWWVTAVGAGTGVVYVLAAYLFLGPEVWGTGVYYAGGVVGGTGAGFVLGTNIYDGLVAGLRAGAYAVVTIAVLATIAFLTLWYSQSGQMFFYWSAFYGLVGFIAFAPIYALTGMVSGAVGVLVRRLVVPGHLNPRPY